MAHILNAESENLPAGRIGANELFVRGLPYDNAAAKFWSALIDEVREKHPTCDSITLYTSTGGLLTAALLNPERLLQSDMDGLADKDLQKEFESIIAAMEVIGPPCPVSIQLHAGEHMLLDRELPLDCVDAEILPFLLVWLLEWANLADFVWNRERVTGALHAEDRQRRLAYDIAFELVSRHLSEGLFQRKVSARFQRKPAAE